MTPGPWTTIWILKAPLGSGTGHSDSGRATDVPSGTWTHQQSPRSGTRQAVAMCCIRDHRPPQQYKDHTQGRRPRDKALPSARRKNTANIHRAWIRMPRRSGFSERDYDRQTHSPNRRGHSNDSKSLWAMRSAIRAEQERLGAIRNPRPATSRLGIFEGSGKNTRKAKCGKEDLRL